MYRVGLQLGGEDLKADMNTAHTLKTLDLKTEDLKTENMMTLLLVLRTTWPTSLELTVENYKCTRKGKPRYSTLVFMTPFCWPCRAILLAHVDHILFWRTAQPIELVTQHVTSYLCTVCRQRDEEKTWQHRNQLGGFIFKKMWQT